MPESHPRWKQDDGHGRQLVCTAVSLDGQWDVAVYGPNQFCNFLYGYARCVDGWSGSFACGYPARADQITFRWDLPNNSWGVDIDGQCWVLYTNRPALRMHPRRILDRTAPHRKPFTDDEIRFECARKRYQKKGTRGGIVEP